MIQSQCNKKLALEQRSAARIRSPLDWEQCLWILTAVAESHHNHKIAARKGTAAQQQRNRKEKADGRIPKAPTKAKPQPRWR